MNFNDRWRAGVGELQAMVKTTVARLPSTCLIKYNIRPDGFSRSMLENSFLILKVLPSENIFVCLGVLFVWFWVVLFVCFRFAFFFFDVMFVWLSSDYFGRKELY